jgi:hypothetical protein
VQDPPLDHNRSGGVEQDLVHRGALDLEFDALMIEGGLGWILIHLLFVEVVGCTWLDMDPGNCN